MKHYIFTPLTAFLLVLGHLTAQTLEHVNLINGDIFLSEGAVENNNNRLATEIDANQYDIRLSYIINYLPIEDRFGTYDGMEFMPFLNTPAEGTPKPPTEAELAAHTKNATDHIIVNAGGLATQAIHIIYTASIYLDEAFKVNYLLDKHYVFGSGISKLDKLKLKQIEAEREFSLSATAEENDNYLNEYVDLIIGAMNDPDYVVTGTVRYGDEIFVDGDYIYIDDQQDGAYFYSQNEPPILTFQVNTSHAISNIDWSEVNPLSADPLLNLSDQNRQANLKINQFHYADFTQLNISYNNGENLTTIYVLPLNLQVTVNPGIIETHAPQMVELKLKNNDLDFENRGDLIIEIVEQWPAGTFYRIETNDPIAFQWDRGNACGLKRFWTHIVETGQEATNNVHEYSEVRVRCAHDLLGIEATTLNDDGQLTSRTAEPGETLYIVSSNNNLDRGVNYKLKWDDVAPEAEDFWTFTNTTYSDDEPIWGLDDENLTIANRQNYYQKNSFNVDYDSEFFPGSGIFNPDIGETDINYFTSSVDVFDQTESIRLAFLRENRHSLDIDVSFLKDLFDIIGGAMIQAGLDVLQTGGNVPGLPGNPSDGGTPPPPPTQPLQAERDKMFEWFYNWNHTAFNVEDLDSPLYLNVREQSISCGLESEPYELKSPWPRIPPNGLIEGYFYLRFSGNIGLAYERASKKIFTESQFQFDAQTVEIAGGISLDAGATLKQAAALSQTLQDYVVFTADVFLSYPFEVKGKIEFPASALDELQTCTNIYREFNHGPGSVNLNVQLSFTGNSNNWDYDWTLLNINHAWPLTDKVMNSCCIPWITENCEPDLNCQCN